MRAADPLARIPILFVNRSSATRRKEAYSAVWIRMENPRCKWCAVQVLVLLGLTLRLLLNWSPVAGASADPQSVTVWTEVAMDENWRGVTHTEPVWLTRLVTGDDDSVALGLVWQRESSGWFASWKLQLYSDTGLLGDAAVIDLMPIAPLGGRVYRAALSYDPAIGAYSVQVTDVGTGQRLVSKGGTVEGTSSTLYPQSWDGGAYRMNVRQTAPAYIPVAVQWGVEGVQASPASSPAILTPGEPWSIHLTTHGSPVPGVFRVYTTTGEARDLVLIVGSEAASGVTAPGARTALPHGFLTVELEYAAIQDGPALLVESLQLSHGAVGFRLASLRQSAGEVHGVLEIAIPIALSSAHLEVKAELAALTWNDATRTYEEVSTQTVTLIDEAVALSAGGNALSFTLPAFKDGNRTHWRLRLHPRLDFPIAQIAGETEAIFSLGADACRLDVMSFNIRVLAADGINTWTNRRPLVERLLREYAPAIIGMQEPAEEQLYDLDGMLMGYRSIRIRPDARARVHNAIYYRPDVVELLAWGSFWLSDTPEVAQSATWGNDEARAVLWARFRFLPTGEVFYVLNTHFHHVDPFETIRTQSAELIRKRLNDLTEGRPAILLGDFNAMPGTPAHRLFTEGENAPFVDAWQAAPARTGPEGTFHGFTGSSGANRIDWVLVTPDIDVLAVEHVTLRDGGIYPSDHFPVYVTLCLPGGS